MALVLPTQLRISVFSPHFNHVYNAQCLTDPALLDQFPQHRTLWELDDPITWEEFSKAVKKLKNAKAPGLTGVPPEAFKAMSPTNLCHVYKHVNDFFLGDADHNQWHCSQLHAKKWRPL